MHLGAGSMHLGAICKGGLHLLSMYCWSREGLSQQNLILMHHNAELIALSHGPWILAADFHMTPKAVMPSGWLGLIKGKLLFPDSPICGLRKYDMFVVSRGLDSAVLGASVICDAGLHPHSPVRLFLKGRPRSLKKRVPVHPRKIPAVLPARGLNDPGRHAFDLDLSREDFDGSCRKVIAASESELFGVSGLEGDDARRSAGRHLGPRFAWQPVLGPWK